MNKAKSMKEEKKLKLGIERSLSLLKILVENSMHISKDKRKVKASIVACVQIKNLTPTSEGDIQKVGDSRSGQELSQISSSSIKFSEIFFTLFR